VVPWYAAARDALAFLLDGDTMDDLHLPHPWQPALPFRNLNLPGWGSNYKPAMLATREQAPSISRASQMRCSDLGRVIHAHSPGEQEAIFLALHNQALFELKEQQALSPFPAPHPLQAHPLTRGRALPSTRGTLQISMDLGLFAFHPKEWELDAAGESAGWRPLAWTGDLLLFMLDMNGPYCVFWDVKSKRGEHAKAGPGDGLRPRGRRAEVRARARYEVQRKYFKDVGIRVVELAREEIDRHVANNLRALFGWTARPVTLSAEARERLSAALAEALDKGQPPIEVIEAERKRRDLSFEECKRYMYSLIWRRSLRVDLFQPVLIDCPLYPQSRDVLDVYRGWFMR
jgi:hypothetical protein